MNVFMFYVICFFVGRDRKVILLVTEQQNLKPVSKPLIGMVKYLCSKENILPCRQFFKLNIIIIIVIRHVEDFNVDMSSKGVYVETYKYM
jgi:hypothetical protein